MELFVSTICTIVMAVVASVSLYFNYKQLKEIKKQWKEEHKPHISILVVAKQGYFLLKVENSGNAIANNIRFAFPAFLKENLMSKQACEKFQNIESHLVCIAPHSSKYFHIHPLEDLEQIQYSITKECFTRKQVLDWLNENKYTYFKVSCVYGTVNSKEKYSAEADLCLNSYIGESMQIIDNELDAMLLINDTLKDIKKMITK